MSHALVSDDKVSHGWVLLRKTHMTFQLFLLARHHGCEPDQLDRIAPTPAWASSVHTIVE